MGVARLGATGEGGKAIINIRKLNLRRRENAVQRTPPRAHSAGADNANYTVLNWNADLGTFQRSSVPPTRAFSESISNVNISFCTLRNIFIWLWERPGVVSLSAPLHTLLNHWVSTLYA